MKRFIAAFAATMSLWPMTLSAGQTDEGQAITPTHGRAIYSMTIAEGAPPASAAILFFRLNDAGEFVEPQSDAEILIMPNNPDTGYEVTELRVEGSPLAHGVQSLPPGRYALNYIRLRELTLFGNAYQAFHQHEPRFAFDISPGETVVLPSLELYKFKAAERKGFKGKGLWSVREGAPYETSLDAFAAAAGVDVQTARFAAFEAIEVECREKRIFLRFKRCEGVAPSAAE